MKGSLFLASLLYGALSRARNFLFDASLLKVRSLPVPVVSVGNLTAGGTGKTPLVVEIGKILLGQGRPIGLLSRGYGRPASRLVVAESSRGLTWRDIGDEPKLIGEALHCPLGIGGPRYAVGKGLLEKFGSRILLLDDGFSHRWLKRDLDILTMDQENPFGRGFLPYGPRREGRSAVKRAHAVVVTRNSGGAAAGELLSALQKSGFKGPLFTAARRAETILAPDGEALPIEKARTMAFYAFSGIARGDRFVQTLEGMGLRLSGSVCYPDHFRFDGAELAQLRANAGTSALLTTEKDFWRLPDPPHLHFLKVRLALDQPKEFESFILDNVAAPPGKILC